MAILDVDLVGIVWIRIFEALLIFVALVTGGWIRAEASSAGWPVRACRVITAIAWAVSIGSVAGFVSRTLWLEIGALLVVLVCFLTSGLIIAAIGEHPVGRRVFTEPDGVHPTGGEIGERRVSAVQEAGSWLAFGAGVVVGGSAFFGRSILIGADLFLVGWLASRRPIPVVWISFVGIAVGLVVGGLITADQAPITIALLTIGVVCSALILRRLASGPARSQPL